MLTYDDLVLHARNTLGEFEKQYQKELRKDSIDGESGAHTVFSLVFVPLLEKALRTDDSLAKTFFDYIELMETEGDQHVSEVAEFTVLEELLDNVKGTEFKQYMGPNTLEAYRQIRRYIIND